MPNLRITKAIKYLLSTFFFFLLLFLLLDYGDYIIHVFKTEDRQFYNLERLWKDAQEITVEAI